jgi:Flp pilus assembly protein TadD
MKTNLILLSLALTFLPSYSALGTIAASLANAGDVPQALEVAQSITDDGWKASTLRAIAHSLANAGQTERAAELLDRALELMGFAS